jgi:putative ABC transport system permease protein
MMYVALRMLVGSRGKYLGIIFGITFAAMLITQQASIFVGLMTRTFGFIRDTGYPDIWVMDQRVQFVDDRKPLRDTRLLQVRGIDGVKWAMPMYKGLLTARLDDGNLQQCNVIGLDDATLTGGPSEMVQGSLVDLRKADGVIVDEVGARTRLARTITNPDGTITRRPLAIGDTIELNDRRGVVVGICRVQRTFQSQPVIYTTYTRATQFAPRERKLLTFVIVGAENTPTEPLARKAHLEALAQKIEDSTGLMALPADEFSWRTVQYFLKSTGIPINFGISVILGFLVGTAIAGQTFYQFTADNIKQFGALKAMGATNLRLLGMIFMQAIMVGLIGYGLGVGLAACFGLISKNSELAFRLLHQTLGITAAAITLICLLSSFLSLWKVFRLEPAIVFK